MKIRNAANTGLTLQNENNIHRNVKKSSFAGEFDKAVGENKKQNLLEITKEIFSQGELVASRCDISELEKYKDLLSSFFNEVMEDSYQVHHGSDNSLSRRKIYSNVKKINTDIEKIASELLKTQKNQVEILACVEDIRGLILDIFL